MGTLDGVNDVIPSVSGAMRASDADRDHVASLLREAFAEGRLDAEEHEERLAAVYSAKTLGELTPIVADLPVTLAPPTATAGIPAQPPTKYSDPIVAIFGEAKRTGRWMVSSDMVATAVFGQVTLDMREAVLERREVTITVNAVFGEVELKVPEGVVVVDHGTAIFGSRVHDSGAAALPDAPVIRLKGVSLFGSVEVRRPGKKRRR